MEKLSQPFSLVNVREVTEGDEVHMSQTRPDGNKLHKQFIVRTGVFQCGATKRAERFCAEHWLPAASTHTNFAKNLQADCSPQAESVRVGQTDRNPSESFRLRPSFVLIMLCSHIRENSIIFNENPFFGHTVQDSFL